MQGRIEEGAEIFVPVPFGQSQAMAPSGCANDTIWLGEFFPSTVCPHTTTDICGVKSRRKARVLLLFLKHLPPLLTWGGTLSMSIPCTEPVLTGNDCIPSRRSTVMYRMYRMYT